MKEIVYLNGSYKNKDEALISPNDRGFIFADGVYEVIKFYNGKPFRMEDHLERFRRSLSEIQIPFHEIDALEEMCLRLIDQNDFGSRHAGIYFQVTRGADKRVHYFPKDIKPTLYGFAFELPSFVDKLEKGISVIVLEDIRWRRCDIKSISLLPNIMMFNQAYNLGTGEALLVRDGLVTEATHSSVLGVRNGNVYTHPLTFDVLPGITRKVVKEICAENDIPFIEQGFTEKEMYELDELMVAGTGSEITPVVEVNGQPVGNKKPGTLTRFLQQKFFEKTV